jgi:hypothetical protein
MQSFELPKITVTGAETKQESEGLLKSTGYYSFELKNEMGDSMQTAFRRFSDFEKLHNSLFRGIDDVVAPEKNYILFSGSDRQISRRIDRENPVSLFNVLQSMLNHRTEAMQMEAMKSEFLEFLSPDSKLKDNWEAFLRDEPVDVGITIHFAGGEDDLPLTVQRSTTADQIRKMIREEMKVPPGGSVKALKYAGEDLEGTIGQNQIQQDARLTCQLKSVYNVIENGDGDWSVEFDNYQDMRAAYRENDSLNVHLGSMSDCNWYLRIFPKSFLGKYLSRAYLWHDGNGKRDVTADLQCNVKQGEEVLSTYTKPIRKTLDPKGAKSDLDIRRCSPFWYDYIRESNNPNGNRVEFRVQMTAQQIPLGEDQEAMIARIQKMVDYARKHRVKLAQTFYLHHNTR